MAQHTLTFAKMNGTGNDFVVFDNRKLQFSDRQLSGMAKQLCPRRAGVGADGLLALAEPREGSHTYRMRYFNADGSRATMCGNGARCLARFARDVGLGSGRLRVESDAGTHHVDVSEDGKAPVRLYMPIPERPPEVIEPMQMPDASLKPVYSIWTGTEHAVCFVDDVERASVTPWGRMLRQDPVFAPTGTNANFVQILKNGESSLQLRIRTYEKGVEAETPACGTGAVAGVWTAHMLYPSEATRAAVHVPGGLLHVGWEGTDPEELYLEGDADITFTGTITIEL